MTRAIYTIYALAALVVALDLLIWRP